MIGYIIKRLIHAIPILIGVNLITFLLFFSVNSPDAMARMHLGGKHVTETAIANWKQSKGYDKPLFYNAKESGLSKVTETLFVKESLPLFVFDFGRSDMGRDISDDIINRMVPSLVIAIPTLLLGLLVNISFSMLLVYFRQTILDTSGMIFCVIIMSISSLFYIIGGQLLFAKWLQWVPISGYLPGIDAFKFVLLPIVVGVVSSLGASTRWYRVLFLEEINKDYVRTARSKGLTEFRILFKHVLKNTMLPILTGVVVLIPMLFMGSLIMESFFGIPGLGSYTIDAIHQQDFSIVRAMVFLGAVLYIVGLILTDVSYTLVDVRVRLSD